MYRAICHYDRRNDHYNMVDGQTKMEKQIYSRSFWLVFD